MNFFQYFEKIYFIVAGEFSKKIKKAVQNFPQAETYSNHVGKSVLFRFDLEDVQSDFKNVA